MIRLLGIYKCNHNPCQF